MKLIDWHNIKILQIGETLRKNVKNLEYFEVTEGINKDAVSEEKTEEATEEKENTEEA